MKIQDYFTKIGVEPIHNSDHFWKMIHKNHGADTYNRLTSIIQHRTNNSDSGINIYEAKNENLHLSKDFSQMTLDFTNGFFQWFQNNQQSLQPRRILEVGCDNGMAACYFATLYPDAEITGIDISTNGILRAKELASQLGLNNITFIQIDLNTFSKLHDGRFDLIISMRTMHELIGQQNYSENFSAKEFINNLHLQKDEAISSIHTLLEDETSMYISCERLSTSYSYVFWSELLKKSGIHINWKLSGYNHSQFFNQEEKSPIFVSFKKENLIQTFDGLTDFLSAETIDEDGRPIVSGFMAEKILNEALDKVLEGGVQINWFEKNEKLRIECWSNKGFAYLYKFTNQGEQDLTQYSIDDLEDVLFEIEMYVAKHTTPKNAEVFDYETLQERDLID